MKNIVRNLFSKIYNNYNKEYLEISNLNSSTLKHFQNKNLYELLKHSCHNVPYYKDYIDLGSKLNNEKTIKDIFLSIPILNKEIIRKNFKKLISNDLHKRNYYYNSSGGSTGEPVKFIQDKNYDRWGLATNTYYLKKILNFKDLNVKKIIIWGNETEIYRGGTVNLRTKIINWMNNSIFLNSFRMTENDIESYIKIINNYKPDIIRGYAGSLFEICKYAENNNKSLYKPKLIISAAETLRFEMRNKIEEIFGTKVHDFYGSREVSNLAGECKEGSMHIFSFWNHLEVLDDKNKLSRKDKEGRIIVTNFFNYSMPLIRYEIGDTAIIGSKKCKCGSILPTLKKITGRVTDHFIKLDGTIIHGEYFTHLFYLKSWVKSFQVIQEDYEKIRIYVVLNSNINISEKEDIDDKIKLVMGKNTKITWEFVEEIKKTQSGKFLYTQSSLWE